MNCPTQLTRIFMILHLSQVRRGGCIFGQVGADACGAIGSVASSPATGSVVKSAVETMSCKVVVDELPARRGHPPLCVTM